MIYLTLFWIFAGTMFHSFALKLYLVNAFVAKKISEIPRCPNHCNRNIPFCLARRICTIAENNAEKLKNLENLKTNLSKYHYPDSLIKQGFQKAFSIPKKDLRKPKKPSNENILPFITIFNNPNIYSTIKSLLIAWKIITLVVFIISN